MTADVLAMDRGRRFLRGALADAVVAGRLRLREDEMVSQRLRLEYAQRQALAARLNELAADRLLYGRRDPPVFGGIDLSHSPDRLN